MQRASITMSRPNMQDVSLELAHLLICLYHNKIAANGIVRHGPWRHRQLITFELSVFE
jgi:hypothetical protein